MCLWNLEKGHSAFFFLTEKVNTAGKGIRINTTSSGYFFKFTININYLGTELLDLNTVPSQ